MTQEWMQYANCKGIDTEEFFTEYKEKIYKNTALLKRVCGNCDVQQACLDYALRNNVLGWWGNTSEATRVKLRNQLGIIPIPVVPDWN